MWVNSDTDQVQLHSLSHHYQCKSDNWRPLDKTCGMLTHYLMYYRNELYVFDLWPANQNLLRLLSITSLKYAYLIKNLSQQNTRFQDYYILSNAEKKICVIIPSTKDAIFITNTWFTRYMFFLCKVKFSDFLRVISTHSPSKLPLIHISDYTQVKCDTWNQ